MAIGDRREEDQLIRDQRAANEEFRNATKVLKEASNQNLRNSLRQELGLTKAGIRASIEDKLLGSGWKRIIYNFVLDRRRDKLLRNQTGLNKADWKKYKKEEAKRKKDIVVAKAREAQRKARDNVLRQTLGTEQAEVQIAELNEKDKTKIQKDERVLQGDELQNLILGKENEEIAEKGLKLKAAEEVITTTAEVKKINKLTDAADAITDTFKPTSDIALAFKEFTDKVDNLINSIGPGDMSAGHTLVVDQLKVMETSLMSGHLDIINELEQMRAEQVASSGSMVDNLISGHLYIGNELEQMRAEQRTDIESPAERDQAKAEAKEWQDQQIDLLQKIADNISGGGGGGGDNEGSGAGGLSGIGKVMGSIGKGIGALGKGIGKGIGMALKGLAVGLKAFSNPKVIVGAAFLAASIAIIGAGIAAATWILGKALPTFAAGMKSFEELDGDALIQVGKGMGAIALGMAAFGVGTAVAGLGSLVGGIASGISSLFGGEDPLEKLLKFQEYNFDEPRITNNANAMVSYGKAMAALGGGQAVAGIGAAVGAIGGAIAGLFGADDPLDKLFEFEKYKFDVARIKSNAEAVKAYAEAMKDFPESPSASIFKAANDAIIGFLGGETDPLAPMIRFGKIKLNNEQIIANSTALKSYAEAMKDFPKSPSVGLFEGFKNAAIAFIGGETDPLAPMIRFGKIKLNTEQIKANSAAVKAYAEAVKDFPESPSVSLLTGVKDAIIGFLGGETDPFAPMVRFSNLVLNTENIVKNAGAVRAYAEAIKDFPESPSVSLFNGVKDAIIGFLGGDTDPFTPMKKFGDMTLNTEGIVKNAGAVRAYAEAMEGLSVSPPSDDVIEGIGKVVMALSSGNPAGLSAFDKAINSINGLDASKISLLQGIKIPEITPQTAAEYEKVFNAMQKNQPDLIDKVSSTLSRFFGSSEEDSGQGSRTAGGLSNSLVAASNDVAGSPLEKTQAAVPVNVVASSGPMSASMRRGELVSASPPVAAAAAGGGGGNISISAPTTNSSQSTASYPITNRPNNPAMDRLRNSLDF